LSIYMPVRTSDSLVSIKILKTLVIIRFPIRWLIWKLSFNPIGGAKTWAEVGIALNPISVSVPEFPLGLLGTDRSALLALVIFSLRRMLPNHGMHLAILDFILKSLIQY
jgi:hypothetical protein